MLTKLRYAAGEGKPPEALSSGEVSSGAKNDTTQSLHIVGMSATMPNVAAVADWLQVRTFLSQPWLVTIVSACRLSV